MGQSECPCLVTGQWTRPRVVKHQEILTELDCSTAQATLFFSLHKVSVDVTFDPEKLKYTREVKRDLDQGLGRQKKAQPQILMPHVNHVDSIQVDQFPCR